MRFRVLGPIEVELDGVAVAPPGVKERTVLARLLVEPARPVPGDALLEAAWPDVEPDRAARSLQVRLARLRALLEPDRAAGAPSSVLVRDGAGYRLAVEPEAVDAVRFARLVEQAAALPAAEALPRYEEALAEWRGPPFADVAYAEFAQPQIRRLEELRATAAEGRARALVDLGRHDAALTDLRALRGAHPLRESVARTLALALYRAGRQVDALDELRRLGHALAELGLATEAATRELERQILVHDAALAAPERAAGGAGAPGAPRRSAAPERGDAGGAPASGARPARPPARRPPPTRLFGREADLARADELLDAGPLVTIAGVGGAGKTRLAAEVVARAAGRFGPATWWCELGPLPAGAGVAGAVAGGVGLQASGAGGVEQLAEHLAAAEGLLVLDNCEHVAAGVAEVADELLAACPGLRLLATSRVELGVAGEQVLRLGGLEAPDGVALFLDRARAAGGTVDAAADAAAVADLCRRLDGLPLAIELAAVRTRSLTVADIAARLDERFALLTVSGRRTTPRHETLRAAIAWSYDLLDVPQRRLFERLSVFARGCTPEGAEAVCAGGELARATIPAVLDGLVSHSLLTVTASHGRTRYAMLETLRELAAERLAERGEAGALRDRHADHLTALALRMLDEGFAEPQLPFIDDFDELRAAVRWCLHADEGPDRAFVLAEALWWPVLSRHGEEIARLVEEVLERWPGPHPLRARVLGAASVARLVVGDPARAVAHAEQALAVAAAAGDPDGEQTLMARRTLAQLSFFTDGPVEALARWVELASLARAAGRAGLRCEADGFCVQLLDAAGHAEAAESLAQSVRAEAAALGSPFMRSWASYVSGVIAIDRRPAEARRRLEEALATAREADHHHMVRFSLRGLGVTATLAGEAEEGRRRLVAALEHDEARADAASQRATLGAFAVLAAVEGDHERAARLLGAAEGWPAAPYLTGLTARARERAGAALGPHRLTALVREGAALDLAAAKALAVAAGPGPGPDGPAVDERSAPRP